MIRLLPPPEPNRKEHPFVGRLVYQGIPVHIENAKGSQRSGTDRDGKKWSITMQAHYGEFPQVEARDGDKLDCYVMDDPQAKFAYVVNQLHVGGEKHGQLDEQKCILGAPSQEAAVAMYRKQYNRPGFFGGVRPIPMERFKQILKQRGRDGSRALLKALTGETSMIHVVMKGKYPQSMRDEMPKRIFAGPHESFPIESQEDVEHAAMLLRHAKDPAAVKRHIQARCRALGLKLPQSWRTTGEPAQKAIRPVVVVRTQKALSAALQPSFTLPRRAARAADPPTAAQEHLATGPKANQNFTHQEMSLPDPGAVRQPHTGPADLYAGAARHKEHLDNLIDRAQGVGTKLGFHIVEGHPPTQEDIEEGHRRGGMVVMAPLKSEKRLHEKARDNFGGDYSRIHDVSRATIAVSHPDDIPHVTHMLRQHGVHYAAQPEDRFVRPTDAGYSDIATKVQDPHGHIGELQVHALDMLHAKELGFHDSDNPDNQTAGHKHYEEMRVLKPKGTAMESLAPQARARYNELADKSAALYGEANNRIQTRTPRLAHMPTHKGLSAGKRKLGESVYKYPGPEELKRRVRERHAPGVYEYEGAPARRREHFGWPEVYHHTTGTWHPVADLGHFDHHANRVTHRRFAKLMSARNKAGI